MLTGKFIGLRAIERSDLPQLLEWRNTPELRRFFRENKERNADQQNEWFEKTVLNDPNTIMFSIVELGTGRLLGACGLCYINWIHRNSDFSIYLGADNLYIDDCLAMDTARVLLKYAFNELQLHRIWAEIYDFDEAKKNFFGKLAFTLDGCHRETYWHAGSWHHSLFYALLCREFTDVLEKI